MMVEKKKQVCLQGDRFDIRHSQAMSLLNCKSKTVFLLYHCGSKARENYCTIFFKSFMDTKSASNSRPLQTFSGQGMMNSHYEC